MLEKTVGTVERLVGCSTEAEKTQERIDNLATHFKAEAEVFGFLYLARPAPHELGHCCKLVLDPPDGGAKARNAFFFPDVIPFTRLTSHESRVAITAAKMSIVF
ncbi:MAG: hypothetical protein ACYSW7_10350 [Planctomycetota bacterium]|jgi:hypothetical protein